MGFFQAVYAVEMSVFPILTGNIAEIGGMLTSYRLLGVFALICALAAMIALRKAREEKMTIYIPFLYRNMRCSKLPVPEKGFLCCLNRLLNFYIRLEGYQPIHSDF